MRPATSRRLLAAFAFTLWASEARAQPALVQLDGETLLVRTFHVPFVPATGLNPLTPRVEPREHHLRFRPQDVRAFRLDGAAVESDAWQAAFKKETAVIFTGYAIVGPDEPAAPTRKVALPEKERELYRKDALIVNAVRSPSAQKPVRPGEDFPKGSPPRLGTASLAPGGRLKVVETVEFTAHYPPRRDGSENQPQNHIFKKTVTTITIDVRLADVGLTYADGKKMAADAARKALEEETTVLISADGTPVHPFFLRLYRPRTVVIAVPQPPGPPVDGPPKKGPPAF